MKIMLRLSLTLAMLSFNFVQPLCADVPISTINIERFKTRLAGTQSDFREWLFAKNPYKQKEALLRGTIKQIPYPYPQVDFVRWSQITMSDTDFNALVNAPIDLNNINFSVTSDPVLYNYQPNGTFWVDFADADKFGGGFRGNGNLEEERMFFEFPQLAQLAYARRNNPPLPVTTMSGIFPTTANAQPFIIFDVFRRFDVSQVPYGDLLKKITVQQVYNDIQTLSPSFAQVNVIGIASLNWCQNPPLKFAQKQYRQSNLLYLLKESLLGNLGAVVSLIEFSSSGSTTAGIHSGQWGTGAFANSQYTVTAIQILSGMMSQIHQNNKQYGIRLHLHGVSSSVIVEAENIVRTELQKPGGNPAKVIDRLLDLQNSDPKKWGPRKKCQRV